MSSDEYKIKNLIGSGLYIMITDKIVIFDFYILIASQK